MRPRDLLTNKQLDDNLIASLPESDYGKVFFRRMQEWLEQADDDYFLTLKISDDDIRQDFRFKAGVIATLKRVIREPARARKELTISSQR